ncbi:tetratricopeptide repeat protein 38 [Hordeum vulgare]|nr:tetratricopeptide repeat protein 38 [Hordeum vulgare]
MAAGGGGGEGEEGDMWGAGVPDGLSGLRGGVDDYYAQTMAFGRGRGPAALRAAAADPACALPRCTPRTSSARATAPGPPPSSPPPPPAS